MRLQASAFRDSGRPHLRVRCRVFPVALPFLDNPADVLNSQFSRRSRPTGSFRAFHVVEARMHGLVKPLRPVHSIPCRRSFAESATSGLIPIESSRRRGIESSCGAGTLFRRDATIGKANRRTFLRTWILAKIVAVKAQFSRNCAEIFRIIDYSTSPRKNKAPTGNWPIRALLIP